MFIIIEGSDAAGKTTLIKQLKERLGYEVVKGSSFEHSQCTQEELYNKFDRMVIDYDNNVIFDRFIYSNYVYASLYGDYAILSAEQRASVEWVINHMSVVIYLHAPVDVLTERINIRGDDYVKAERIPAILDKYEEVLPTIDEKIPVWSYDTSQFTTKDIVSDIITSINRL